MGTPTNKITTPTQGRFLRPGGTRGEVLAVSQTLRKAISFLLPLALADFVAPTAGFTAAANAVMASTASSLSAVTLVAGLDGAATAASKLTKDALDTLPHAARALVFTSGGTAAQQYDTATIWGVNAYGRPMREVVTLAKTAVAVTSKNFWQSVSRVELAAGTGTAATLVIGFSNTAALPAPAKVRGTAIWIAFELRDGVTSAGSVATQAAIANVSPTYYVYAPGAAFDGVASVAVAFESDPFATV